MKDKHTGTLMAFMRAHLEQDNTKKLERNDKIAGMYVLQALDHALVSGCGLGLRNFLTQRVVGPVPVDHVRFFISPGDDGTEQFFLGGSTRRACLLNRTSSDTMLEAPRTIKHGEVKNSALHVACDRESSQWRALYWLYHTMPDVQLRGFLVPDKWHKVWNLTKGAFKSAGMSPFLSEMVLVTNVNCGPWKGDAFFDVVKGSAQAMFKKSDESRGIFLALYDRISADLGIVGDLDFGEQEHIEKAWRMLPGCDCFRKKGNKTKLARWFSVFDSLSLNY